MDDGDGVGEHGWATAVDPSDPRHLFFIRRDTDDHADAGPGIAESTDGGATWKPLNDGLGVLNVSALAYGRDGSLFAGTACAGTWYLPAAVTSVSAASFTGSTLASEAIASAFGQGLAASTQVATTVPLPTTLAGATLRVTDSGGTERLAPLFFVSPGQINYLIPSGVRSGPATVKVTSGSTVLAAGAVQIEPVSPGLFAANENGRGVAAALAVRVLSDGSQVTQAVFQQNAPAGSRAAVPIDFGAPTDQVILVLFGTGIRGLSSLSALSVRISDVNGEVLFAGPQAAFVGLDQVNVRLPRSLMGRGEVEVLLTVDGKTANKVTIHTG